MGMLTGNEIITEYNFNQFEEKTTMKNGTEKQPEVYDSVNRVKQIARMFAICRTLTSHGIQFNMRIDYWKVMFTFTGTVHINGAISILADDGNNIYSISENEAGLRLSW